MTQVERQVRHCVVVGATGGIGAALTRRLLSAGWSVTAVGRAAPDSSVAALQTVRCDLAHADQIDRVAPTLGPIDRLVFAHGVFCSAPAFVNGVEKQHAINADAVRRFCDAVQPPRRTVFVGSDAWRRASFEDIGHSTGLTAYRASKRALLLHAVSLARRGWDIHTVHPGVVRTDIAKQAAWWVRGAHRALSACMGRSADEAARTVERLLTEDQLTVPSGTYWNERKPYPSVPADLLAESLAFEAQLEAACA